MAFRSFLIIGLLLSGFFYWDINQNKSINVNLIQNQLQKYGLLEKTQQIIETFNKLMFDAKKYIEQNVPIWYKKTMTTLTPYVNRVSNLTIEYSTLAWTKSEPYRDLASVYYEQSRKYIEINLPIVINKSLTYLELVIENSIKAFDTCMVYVNQAVDFTETKLGLEKGEFDRIFLDAYQILKQKVNTGMNWLYKNLMTNIY